MTGRPADNPLDALRTVAVGLGDLLPEVVFVGGAAAPLLISDIGSEGIRPTDDVDLIIRADGYGAYGRLGERLRSLGFAPDTSEGAPLCRFQYEGIPVDVMPTSGAALGFTNRWYRYAVESAESVDLDGVTVRVASAVAFVATKLEAFRSETRRHAGDVLASHDLEDLVAVLDGRPLFESEFSVVPGDVREFVTEALADLLADHDFIGAIEGHLPPGPTRTERARRIIAMMQRLTET